MKQLTAKETTVGGKVFYIKPFPAFKAAGISGELFSTLGPIIGSVLPMLSGNWMDTKVEDLAASMSTLNGDNVEQVARNLLTRYGNVSVSNGDSGTMLLTEELANETFCGEVENMFVLMFEVIKVNYTGFFEKVLHLYGAGKKSPGAQGKTKQT